MNDNLPQVMCKSCINIVNEHINFLHQCKMSHLILLNRMHFVSNTEGSNENNDINMHKETNDEDENILKSNENDMDEKSNNYCNNNGISRSAENLGIFESTVEDLLKKQLDIKVIDYVPRKKAKLVYEETDVITLKKHNDEKKDTIGPIECKYCKKILKTKNSLSSHYKIHYGPNIVCEHCGKKFMSKRRLLMHCKSKHGYEKTDKCSYCEYKGSNAELVKIHERTHTGERPYVCSRCGAAFHRRSTYLQHMPIHLTEKTVPVCL
ncbi:unnamed protein product [Diatraea saccharalis]|uniref:C2H2-type domain-containing protein n=1 Tax=Diatraea saccharalis TaxID=40085 RepID=A0A9N9WFN9_9NEOP|nr:unnamed protein product [Diatraea saccharalis]